MSRIDIRLPKTMPIITIDILKVEPFISKIIPKFDMLPPSKKRLHPLRETLLSAFRSF